MHRWSAARTARCRFPAGCVEMPITRKLAGPEAVWTRDAVAEPGSGGAGDVALDDGDVGPGLLLGGGVPASGGEPVAEHRRLLHGPDPRVLAGERRRRWRTSARRPRRRGWRGSGPRRGRRASGRPPATILTSSPWSPHEPRLALAAAVAMPSTASRVPTASAITSAVDRLRRRRRPTLRSPICAGRGRKRTRRSSRSPASWPPAAEPGRLERVPHRHPDGAPDRGQRGQRRPEQPHQRAGEHDGPVDAEADAGREERSSRSSGSGRRRARPRGRSRRRFPARRAAARSSGRPRRSAAAARRPPS